MKERETIEVEEDISLKHEDGLMATSIFGEVSESGMADKERRVDDFKKRNRYQEYVPCVACSHCIEFRRFSGVGEAVSVGFYCCLGEFVVSEFGNCVNGHERRDGRRKVIYDKQNAPLGFETGMVPIRLRRLYTKKEKFKEAVRQASNGYRGGGASYTRADGDMEAIGTGRIPRGLGN